MTDALKIYLAVCLLALLIKFAVALVNKAKGKVHTQSHEAEHDLGNYIKIFILILLGLLLLYLAKTNVEDNYTAMVGLHL